MQGAQAGPGGLRGAGGGGLPGMPGGRRGGFGGMAGGQAAGFGPMAGAQRGGVAGVPGGPGAYRPGPTGGAQAAGAGGPAGSGAQMEYNERIRQFYALHLANEGQSEIFRDTEFWNFGYWTQTTQSQNEACENMLEVLLSFIPEKTGRILDVACGKGATTRHLLRYFDPADVMGVNISPEQIAVCRERLPEVRFEVMDAADLQFADNELDSIITVEAICHFNTREKFLKEALRVLKPGGHLVFSDSLMRAETAIQPRENYIETADHYAAIGRAAGFERVEVYDTTEECWNRFARFHMQRAMTRMRSGEIAPQNVQVTGMWLRRAAPVAYVVGWMRKPGG